ncbi:MAG: CYTH domain-containing protein [Promethearchaeota archaeon]
MPFREYETKVIVANEEKLLMQFQQLGATLLKRVIQRDCYYDSNYKLTKKDQLLRIRTEETIDTHEFKMGEFSWKSGRKGKSYEVREDISISLTSSEAVFTLEIILNRLGFRKFVWLVKYRDRWVINDVEFEFDQNIVAQTINRPQKKIGSYLQATIETEREYPSNQIREILWNSLKQLGFNRTHLRRESYIELYLLQLNELDFLHLLKKQDL